MLRRIIEDWLALPEPAGESLLPPIQRAPGGDRASDALKAVVSWLPLGIEAAVGYQLLIRFSPPGLLPEYVGSGRAVGLGFFVALIFPSGALFEMVGHRFYDADISKRIAKG